MIIGVDHRADEKQQDFNLPVVNRYVATDVLEQAIRLPAACDIRIPLENIRAWKEQFRGQPTEQDGDPADCRQASTFA